MTKTIIHPVKARTMPFHRRCANRILIRDGGKWREGRLCIHIPSMGNELHVFYHPFFETSESSLFSIWHGICRKKFSDQMAAYFLGQMADWGYVVVAASKKAFLCLGLFVPPHLIFLGKDLEILTEERKK